MKLNLRNIFYLISFTLLASLLRIILLTATLKILERGLDKGPIIKITIFPDHFLVKFKSGIEVTV